MARAPVPGRPTGLSRRNDGAGTDPPPLENLPLSMGGEGSRGDRSQIAVLDCRSGTMRRLASDRSFTGVNRGYMVGTDPFLRDAGTTIIPVILVPFIV